MQPSLPQWSWHDINSKLLFSVSLYKNTKLKIHIECLSSTSLTPTWEELPWSTTAELSDSLLRRGGAGALRVLGAGNWHALYLSVRNHLSSRNTPICSRKSREHFKSTIVLKQFKKKETHLQIPGTLKGFFFLTMYTIFFAVILKVYFLKIDLIYTALTWIDKSLSFIDKVLSGQFS